MSAGVEPLRLRYSMNGNAASDLLAQLDGIREGARSLNALLGGDFDHGRNYQHLPADQAAMAMHHDGRRVRHWRLTLEALERDIEATMAALLEDDRVRKAHYAMEREGRR